MQEQPAYTPQNLFPLLSYAKEVRAQLTECLEGWTGIMNEFIGIDPRLRNPRHESGVDKRVTTAEGNTDLVGKGYHLDWSLESVEITRALRQPT
jgi:hypothetical protein